MAAAVAAAATGRAVLTGDSTAERGDASKMADTAVDRAALGSPVGSACNLVKRRANAKEREGIVECMMGRKGLDFSAAAVEEEEGKRGRTMIDAHVLFCTLSPIALGLVVYKYSRYSRCRVQNDRLTLN